MSGGVLQVVTTDECGILRGLVRGEVSNEPPVAERGGVAVEHKQAPSVAWEREQLTSTTVSIQVAGKQIGGDRCLTAPRSDTGERETVGAAPRG
jgi:hypothetical protein